MNTSKTWIVVSVLFAFASAVPVFAVEPRGTKLDLSGEVHAASLPEDLDENTRNFLNGNTAWMEGLNGTRYAIARELENSRSSGLFGIWGTAASMTCLANVCGYIGIENLPVFPFIIGSVGVGYLASYIPVAWDRWADLTQNAKLFYPRAHTTCQAKNYEHALSLSYLKAYFKNKVDYVNFADFEGRPFLVQKMNGRTSQKLFVNGREVQDQRFLEGKDWYAFETLWCD